MNTVVLTGATSGIGFSCARLLAAKNYNVIGIGRNDKRCDDAKNAIIKENPQARISYYTADLSKLGDINRVADEISEYIDAHCNGKLHALINNAGCARGLYTTTEDGYEQLFALNVLSGFLITYRLLPMLINASGRVIMTGSGSHKGIKVRWNDVMLKDGYNPLTAYKQSKLCCMLFAKGLDERYASNGIRAYVVDPGLVNTDIGCKDAGGLVKAVWSLRKRHGVSPDAPASVYSYICDADTHPNGFCLSVKGELGYSKQVTAQNADKLFGLCERLCGITYE